PELVYAMDTGGNERTQLYRLHGVGAADHGLGDGWTSTDLTREPKAVHTFGGWSHGGEHIAFSANREDPSRFDVYVQGRGDAEARLVRRGPGGLYTPAGWSPDDQSLLVSRGESNYNQDLFVVDVASGRARRLTPHEGDAQYHSPEWSTDGRSVYCVSTAG